MTLASASLSDHAECLVQYPTRSTELGMLAQLTLVVLVALTTLHLCDARTIQSPDGVEFYKAFTPSLLPESVRGRVKITHGKT